MRPRSTFLALTICIATAGLFSPARAHLLVTEVG
jgi:hypothetical protein